jgi:hypothetical protein
VQKKNACSGVSRRTMVSLSAAFVLAASASHGADHFKNSDAPRLGMGNLQPTPEMQKLTAENEAEHAREMTVLGLTALRGGHNGIDPDAPNAANYDEALAGPFEYTPDVLRLKNGDRVAMPSDWWNKRRPQIVAAFESEIYGRLPVAIPAVKWDAAAYRDVTIGSVKAVSRRIVGHVDNSAYPAIAVDIQMEETLPADVKAKVPVIIQFGWLTPPKLPAGMKMPASPPGPDWREQILARGWGYVILDPSTIQADNGAGLNKGIIGLVNKGGLRSMDAWGALRAWGWGASRALDYLATDPHVAANQVGIAGHSRYGKAALVTMAFDPRFAVAYVSSSGAGGAKLLKRFFGETLEDVAQAHEFHWMAGNFMKYAADPLSVKDLPVDADALLALCAPRSIFIGAGSNAAGDAWTDAKGMFIAAIGAGPAYRLLGKKDLGTDQFPGVGPALVAGDIGFRQHQYGHTQDPNWPTFLTFAAKYLK